LVSGIPIYSVATICLFGLLSFLNVGENSAVVFGWFVNVVGSPIFLSMSVLILTLCRQQ
jgi:amino acid transporter